MHKKQKNDCTKNGQKNKNRSFSNFVTDKFVHILQYLSANANFFLFPKFKSVLNYTNTIQIQPNIYGHLFKLIIDKIYNIINKPLYWQE